MTESDQTLTYLVTVKTYGKRAKVKSNVGHILARCCRLNFMDASVQFVSKVDVPKTKPYEVEEIPSGIGAVD